MPIQSDDLVMTSVGVHSDQPTESEQPKLVDGIHLRWAFPRPEGFPWYGYYLYRRPHEFRGQVCLQPDLAAQSTGPLGAGSWDTSVGGLTSDAALDFTDDFPPTGQAEVDLAGRAWVRLDLPPGEPIFRADVTIGCRGVAGVARGCARFDHDPPRRMPTPVDVDGVRVRAVGDPSGRIPFVVERAGPLGAPGLAAREDLLIELPAGSSSAEVLATVLDGPADLQVVDRAGQVLGSTRATGGTGRPQRLEVRLPGRGAMLRLAVGGRVLVHRICSDRATAAPSRIAVRALDGDVEVARTEINGTAGDVVTATLVADRITAVEIAGGDAVLVGLCVRPVLLGLAKDWAPVPNCPQPLTLPITHPDYPASRGALDPAAAWASASARVTYGPAATWQAGFPALHDTLAALLDGGPAGASMADDSRAATNVAGSPAPPGPGPAGPHLGSLHPLDLVLLGALHPPLAQLVGLYWADTSAHPLGTHDYLVVADADDVGTGSAARVLAAITGDWDLADGWVCFARTVGPSPPPTAPASAQAFALPGGTFPTADGTLHAGVGNVGLRWAADRDPSGRLSPDAPVFHHVWRHRLGDQSAPQSPGGGELATLGRPLLTTRPPGIRIDPPHHPSDWPQFSLQFVDAMLGQGWYGYQLTAVDIFGRFSARTAAAPWCQWAPAPDPKPWYYVDPPADREVHPSAVRLRDTERPPTPAALEAAIQDPRDPQLLRDQRYLDWRARLPADVRDTLVGLRVRWRWTVAQQRQAPDAVEFRIYYHPGTQPPAGWADVAVWQQRCDVRAIADGAADAGGNLTFDVFVPVPVAGEPFAAGVPLTPSLADPIAYAQVSVTAADGTPQAADRWPGGGRWANRTGLESRAASPARVVRVQRDPPPPPEPVVDSARVYATAADWHGRSYYSFRWRPAEHLRTHAYRAMDEAVFAVDWARRPRPALDPNDASRFPDPVVEPDWTLAKRTAVADTLNAFSAMAAGGVPRNSALAAYRALSDDALRVLGNLPGLERAYTQLTQVGLDPADPATADRRGPDDPPGYQPRAALRVHLDVLDGRALNRYLYRAAAVDAAQNRSVLGAAGTPVRLPNTVPPRAPARPRAAGGNRAISLAWPSNREPDLLEYRVYRAETAAAAADLRSMTLAGTVAADPSASARPAEVTWTDAGVPGLADRWYRVVAVDRSDPVDPRGGGANVSNPSVAVTARAFDTAPPVPPVPAASWVGVAGAELPAAAWTSEDETRLQARELPSGMWTDVGGWRAAGTHSVSWASADAGFAYQFRLHARKYTGAVAVGAAAELPPR